MYSTCPDFSLYICIVDVAGGGKLCHTDIIINPGCWRGIGDVNGQDDEVEMVVVERGNSNSKAGGG